MTERRAVYQAAALVDAGSPAAAMRVLTPYLASEPDDPYALCIGAQSLIELEDSRRALELARRASMLRPDDDWPIRLRALALRNLSDFEQSRAVARRSVQVNPGNWQTHYLVALSDLWANAVTHNSMEAAVRARELAPEEGDTHRLLGSIALELRKPRIASRSLEQALLLNPEDAVARHELARAQVRMLRFGKALHGFLAVGQMDPTISQTQQNLHRLAVRAVVVLHYTMLITFFSSAFLPIETAVGVGAVGIAIAVWVRFRGGPALLRFARTLWVRDRFLVVWAGLLLISAVLVIVRPLLWIGHPHAGGSSSSQQLLTLGRALILVGAVISWIRRSRLKT